MEFQLKKGRGKKKPLLALYQDNELVATFTDLGDKRMNIFDHIEDQVKLRAKGQEYEYVIDPVVAKGVLCVDDWPRTLEDVVDEAEPAKVGKGSKGK